MIDAANIPLGLYVHLPWCLKKCPYCDFNSHEARGPLPEASYVDALLADMRFSLRDSDRRPIVSVYIGGGTPSLFPASAIDRLIGALARSGRLAADAEITLEANPGAADASRFAGYRAAGVNRLSIGIQSFSDRALAALGRVHDAKAACRAIDAAAGYFDNLNLDLMYGLPGQSAEDAASDIAAAIASGAPHLSCYQLTIEPNTVFYKRTPALPGEAEQAAIESVVIEALAAAGYEHYEVSAHARPGRRCRHNLNYWQFGDYIGIGAGAHGKLSQAGHVSREARLRVPAAYEKAAGTAAAVTAQRRVEGAELGFEFMLNALRLREGFDLGLYTARTGNTLGRLQPALDRCARHGLLQVSNTGIRPSRQGWRYLNRAIAEFLPPSL